MSDLSSAAQIFFRQAERPDLRDATRCLIPTADKHWTPVTWGEMAGRIERLAAFLISMGVDRDTKVAIFSNTRLEWGLAGLATQAARGVLVPVYPTLVGEQLEHILSHSDARVLFVETEEQLARVTAIRRDLKIQAVIRIETSEQAAGEADPATTGRQVLLLDDAEALGAEALARSPQLVADRLAATDPDDVGCLLYTSGTTGLPKGVMLSHRNLAVNGADWIAVNGHLLHEGDVDILWLPMSHIFGWGQFCLGNQLGFRTYFSDPMKALAQLQELRPQVFMSVPLFWEKLANQARAASSDPADWPAALRRVTGGRLGFCLSGGAGLPRQVKELFREAGILIIEGYGLTECSPTLTMNRSDDYDFESVGKPFPRVRLKIAQDGEILAKGENVFVGYYKDEAATRACFDDEGWLRTGDVGRFNERGYLQITGRKKEILVTAGGKNVPPENVEGRFRGDPLLVRIVVYGDGKPYLTAVVDIDDACARTRLEEAGEAPGSAPRTHPRVREWVLERIETANCELPRYEQIRGFVIAEEPLTIEGGFLTPSLKVKRSNVYARYGPALDQLYAES